MVNYITIHWSFFCYFPLLFFSIPCDLVDCFINYTHLMFKFRKYSHPHQGWPLEIQRGWVVSIGKLVKGKYDQAKLRISRDWGHKASNHPWGVRDIFWNHTICVWFLTGSVIQGQTDRRLDLNLGCQTRLVTGNTFHFNLYVFSLYRKSI